MPKRSFAGRVLLLSLLLLGVARLPAQFSTSAYRVLGQPDLRQNALNLTQGAEFSAPQGVALDANGGELRLYVSDTNNHRILAWKDVLSFRREQPADLILGQPTPYSLNPLGIGTKGLAAPLGISVDPTTGHLYVADFGNSRVLRFSAPFDQQSQIEPDAVYGQPDFSIRTPNTGGLSNRSMNGPRGVAFDRQGNLWVADSGNNRVLRFPRGVLDGPNPGADLVIGQQDFNANAPNGGRPVGPTGLDAPAGLAFDPSGSLYVSDFRNARVLKFSTPQATNQQAVLVLGQANFTNAGVSHQLTGSSLGGPAGLAVDRNGRLLAAIPGDNRVLVFPPDPTVNAPAVQVLGQAGFTTRVVNEGAFPLASASSLAGPVGLGVDPDGNVFVADTANNRVLSFPTDSKPATQVWGQPDLTSNSANQIEPGSIDEAFDIAIDYSQTPFALYVSDTNNHRILIWEDSARFTTGAPPGGVIGQPSFLTAQPNVDTGSSNPSAATLSSPKGLVVDTQGNLYVADSENNRVLRYPRPVGQQGRIVADIVIGQQNLANSASAAVTPSSLKSPSGVALGPDGSLFVSDTGNHRVLQFPAGASTGASAVGVYGQPNLHSSTRSPSPSAFSLNSPEGIHVDQFSFLYVADTGANRVLVYPGVQNASSAGPAAAIVVGQGGFASAAAGGGSAGLRGPRDVAVDNESNLVISDSGNHRILVFSSAPFLPFAGAAATSVAGQPNLGTGQPNWNSPDGLATAEGLSSPGGAYLDRHGTLYVADRDNHRVAHFPRLAVAVNASHFRGDVPVSPGALVSLFGSGFAEGNHAAPLIPLPRALAGREVEINDELKAPLLFLSPNQINLQFPMAAPTGTGRIAVRLTETGEMVAGGPVLVAPASPGLLSTGDSNQGLVLNQDGSLNLPAKPAKKGSVVTLFGTGQGEVTPAVAEGEAAPSSPPAKTVAEPTSDGSTCLTVQRSVCVAVGSTFGEVQFSGLAPGFAGLWQLNVKIPETALSGSVPVRAVIQGRPSNIVTVAVE